MTERYGWICPKCNQSNSPDVKVCPNCSGQISTPGYPYPVPGRIPNTGDNFPSYPGAPDRTPLLDGPSYMKGPITW